MQAISTNKLTKSYGNSRGIIELDLQVEQGQFYGFIGPNGAGKSTTIRTLLGLIAPTSGSARVLDMDIATQKKQILSRVGYLPSEAMLYRGMRGKEILDFSAKLRGCDCRREAQLLCSRLELDVEKKVEELSFGNRKKLAIVCALQHKPDLYILDEPTSGLDPLMQREFYAILQERNQEGATVFLSSHVLSEVGRYCTHAAVIREGRLLVADKVEKLGHTGVKRVSLRGASTVPTLEGIRDQKQEGENCTFLYSGSADDLVKALAQIHVEDFSIADPDLEEVFLHYYTGEEC